MIRLQLLNGVPSRELNSEEQNMPLQTNRSQTIRAILTDVQFWIPAIVLTAGIALLVILH